MHALGPLEHGPQCTEDQWSAPAWLPITGSHSHRCVCLLQPKPPPSNNHTAAAPSPGQELLAVPSGYLQLPSACEWAAHPTATHPKSPKTHQCLRLPQNPNGQGFKFPKLYLLPKDGAAKLPCPAKLPAVCVPFSDGISCFLVDYKYLLHTLARSEFSLGT